MIKIIIPRKRESVEFKISSMEIERERKFERGFGRELDNLYYGLLEARLVGSWKTENHDPKGGRKTPYLFIGTNKVLSQLNLTINKGYVRLVS